MDHHRSEWQLALFTALTQMSVGIVFYWGLAANWIPHPNPFTQGLLPTVLLTVALGALILGALSAGLHLGRPSQAVFSIANLRTSWLSREAVLGGNFGLLVFLGLIRRWVGVDFGILDRFVSALAILVGLGLVYVIARLYMLRTVPAWDNIGTPAAFFTTVFLLGLAAMTAAGLALMVWADAHATGLALGKMMVVPSALIALLTALQMGIFVFVILSLTARGGVAAESARLIWTDLRSILIWRTLAAFLGIGILILLPWIWLSPVLYLLALGVVLVSEVLGRLLFYGFYRREGF